MPLIKTILNILGGGTGKHRTKRQAKGYSAGRHGVNARPAATQSVKPKAAAKPSGLLRGMTTAYHGTPSLENARSIVRNGWMVGSGNALGDGIYFAKNLSTAKSYASSGGVYLKCAVKLGRTCTWDANMQRRFQDWCRKTGATQDRSAQTSFLLKNGFDTIQNGEVIVVLAPQYANPTAHKRKDRRIRILSVHLVSDNARVRV